MQKKRIEQIAKGRTNLFSLHWRNAEPATIRREGAPAQTKLNTRQDFGDLPEFAMSLADGVKEPLLGYMGENGKFQITNGERRWRGAQWMQEKKGIIILLPCVRESQGYTDTDRNIDLLRTNNGKPLEMIEKAEAMKRLLDAGVKEKEIAQKAGCSQTHVVDCLALINNVAPAVQEAVRKGEMKATLAVDLARQVPDTEKQTEILQAGKEKAMETARPRAVRAEGSPAPKTGRDGGVASPKITAKHLPIATGKKAATQRRGRPEQSEGPHKPQTGSSFSTREKKPVGLAKTQTARGRAVSKSNGNPGLEKLEELFDAVERGDCESKERYDTLEFLCEYVAGRQGTATATKFILGII